MKTLTFKKVHETPNQRFYELSEPVDKFCNENFNLKVEIEYTEKRINEEYREFLPTEKVKYICVSDAHTHIERLVFIAMPINYDLTDFAPASMAQIDGKHTFMIDGGNPRHVHPDEVYLKRLAKINNMQFQLLNN